MIKEKLYKKKALALALTTLVCTNSGKVMALTSEELLKEVNISEKSLKISEVQDKELLITEILPDSSNVNGADAYEFIEIYNNSNRELSLKDYKIYYNYPDKGVIYYG